VAKLAEILRDTRPDRRVTAMFIDMTFGSPIYECQRALGFNNVYEVTFGLRTHRTRLGQHASVYVGPHEGLAAERRDRDRRKDGDDLAGATYHIDRSNLLVLEDMQKRGQASPDDGDALALTSPQAVAPAEKEERDEDDEFRGHGGINGPGAWMR